MVYSKTEAAYLILKSRKKPLHTSEILKVALDKNMIKTKGKTPESTLASDLLLENKRRSVRGAEPRFERVGPRVWGLTEWK